MKAKAGCQEHGLSVFGAAGGGGRALAPAPAPAPVPAAAQDTFEKILHQRLLESRLLEKIHLRKFFAISSLSTNTITVAAVVVNMVPPSKVISLRGLRSARVPLLTGHQI